MGAKPLRNPLIEWEGKDGGRALLTVPRRSQGLFGWLGRVMRMPVSHRVELEPVGATVWQLCDGKTTVEGIVRRLCETYKMNRVEAEVSLHAFLATLSQRGYVALFVSKKR